LPAHKPFKNIRNHNLRVHCAGNADSWDYQYSYLNLIHRRLSIIPNTNLISNIGCSENPTHFIQNHPFADIPLSEMSGIVHPSFMIADIEADIHSQKIEYQITSPDVRDAGFLFIKEKLTGRVSGKDNRIKIPKIIHQIYFDMSGVPEHLSEISQTWKEKHPAWEYRFWNQKAVEQFMESGFPDLLPLYRSFPFNVQRWDFVRYLILYRYGGLYVDMDYECLDPLDSLLWNATCCMGMEPAAHALRYRTAFIVGNALMASVPGHNYFDRIIKDISSGNWQKYQNKGSQVVEFTGPFMTTRIYDGYERKDEIALLPAELVAPLSLEEVQQLIAGKETAEMEEKVEKAFAVHYFFGSWVKQLNR